MKDLCHGSLVACISTQSEYDSEASIYDLRSTMYIRSGDIMYKANESYNRLALAHYNNISKINKNKSHHLSFAQTDMLH